MQRTSTAAQAWARTRPWCKCYLEALESRLCFHGEAGELCFDPAVVSLNILDGQPSAVDPVIETLGNLLAAGTYALSSIPILNSLPGAAATLYLDFDGHFESSWGGYSNITTPVFDQDGDFTTFSDAELAAMQNIWKIVAEDYAVFKINVTTVAPFSFANGAALRVSIGGNGSWTGGSYGGVSYVDSFTNSIVNTAYVFTDNLGHGTARYVGEAVSHESGHAFGLQHQSQYDASGVKTAEYYQGPGDGTAPIMGNSYYTTRGLWWNGTTLSANTIQDDMAVISRAANGFGYRLDDHGNSAGSGTALTLSGNQLSGTGLINATNDLDYLTFSTDAGAISLAVNVLANYNDLDARLELRDAGGTLIASASPTNSFGATLNVTVAAGSYRLVVGSSGGYGNVGTYNVSGTVIPMAGTVNTPTNLSATAATEQIALSWNDNANNETRYSIERSTDGVTWSVLARLLANTTTYNDQAVSAGITYWYRVAAASDSLSSDYSNVVYAALPPAVPAAPGNLQAVATSSSQINLSWTDVAGETNYRIERSLDGGTTWTLVATVNADIIGYQNTGLAANTTYTYRVIANNSGGDSAPSNLVMATTPSAPVAPSTPGPLTAVAVSSSQVTITWTDNANNELGFKLERTSNGGKSWNQIAQLGPDVTSFTDNSVNANKSYSYRLRAYNEAGNSAYSNLSSVTTPSSKPGRGAIVIDSTNDFSTIASGLKCAAEACSAYALSEQTNGEDDQNDLSPSLELHQPLDKDLALGETVGDQFVVQTARPGRWTKDIMDANSAVQAHNGVFASCFADELWLNSLT